VPVPNVQWINPDDGQRNCPKHVEFRTRIYLEIGAFLGFIVKKLVKIFVEYKNMAIHKIYRLINFGQTGIRVND
jgi:hypothetical protein